MSITLGKALLIAAVTPALLNAQQFRNMTGDWQLDVNSSIWGNANKPLYVAMKIDHREPFLQYSGSVAYANEEIRTLAFDGRIDGHEYAMVRSFGSGRIAIRRSSPSTIQSVFKTDDGKYVESAVTTVSRDGRQLTRRIHVTGPAGDTNWTEVYRRH